MGLMLDVLNVAVVVLHLIACPFTKVEESFNMQAMHDLIHHGSNISEYDHLEFPGVVPRTFLGPLAVVVFSWPMVYLRMFFQFNKFFDQYICRFVLGMFTMFSFFHFKSSVSKSFNKNVGKWLSILTMIQFHFNFYATRSLPNTFALIGVMLATSYWLRGRSSMFIMISAFTVLIFRAELVMFVAMLLLLDLIQVKITFTKAFLYSLISGILAIGVTVSVDSIFWKRWLWPEFEVLWFNTVLNKSSLWGTMPFLWYFYSALPRCLGPTLVLIPAGCYLNKNIRQLVMVALLFVLMYSFLPHKELRFVIYVVPLLNVASAVSCHDIARRQRKGWLHWFMFRAIIILLSLSALLSLGFLFISSHNYPGGEALTKLHKMRPDVRGAHLHIDVFSAQTGITRFLQIKDWRYNKTEKYDEGPRSSPKSFRYLLVGADPKNLETDVKPYYLKTHKILDFINSYHKISFTNTFPFIDFAMIPKIYIYEKIVNAHALKA